MRVKDEYIPECLDDVKRVINQVELQIKGRNGQIHNDDAQWLVNRLRRAANAIESKLIWSKKEGDMSNIVIREDGRLVYKGPADLSTRPPHAGEVQNEPT